MTNTKIESNLKENINLTNFHSNDILKSLYGKDLVSKKNVLEFTEIIKVNHGNLTSEQLQEVYNLIWQSIDEMHSQIKPNTIMHLKNQLKTALGKYVSEKEPKGETNTFLEFFKEAYPPKERTKGYTRVLMDSSKITIEQIWHTLTYINALCLKNTRLSSEQQQDTIKMIETLINSRNIKYINRVKSLEKLLNVLKIKIITLDKGFKVKTLS